MWKSSVWQREIILTYGKNLRLTPPKQVSTEYTDKIHIHSPYGPGEIGSAVTSMTQNSTIALARHHKAYVQIKPWPLTSLL